MMQTLNGLVTLLILSSVMCIVSFGSGMLPLIVSLRPDKLRVVSTVGTGVLMGTSLIVIIPEGVETLYTASIQRHKKPVAPGRPIGTPDIGPIAPPDAGDNADDVGGVKNIITIDHDEFEIEVGDDESSPKSRLAARITQVVGRQGMIETHKYAGVALLAGFMIMYLIDKLPEYFNKSLANSRHIHRTSVDVSELRTFSTIDSAENGSNGYEMRSGEVMNDAGNSAHAASQASALTTGLVIHAAADGIALGASAASTSSALELVVFFAILVHKAPAAFGMAAVLLRSGVSRRKVRQYLLIFALAAPLSAIMTWVGIVIVGTNVGYGAAGIRWWTGMILLFSGGAFLYVAIHVMNETQEVAKVESPSSSIGQSQALLGDIFATLIGLMIPLATLFVDDV
ncbi:Zinc/iron permease [Lipomyces oligophaga]|uniref:Zinc/iron permease n=1 Tax=Lipomyces oligophaga TaxID=45792 RepID=UPI0034CFDB30